MAAVRDLNRLEPAGETLRAALEALACAAPKRLVDAVPVREWAERYGPRTDSWHPPAPERQSMTRAGFLRSRADALLACAFFETRILTGVRLYAFAVLARATRRIRIPGTPAHPTADWVVQLGRNLAMDLKDAGSRARFLIRDRDPRFTQAFDAVPADAGLEVVLSGIRMSRMNSLMERWIRTCRRELLDHTLIWNQRHLLQALCEFGSFCNRHRPHRALGQVAPLLSLPEPITAPGQLAHLRIRRRDRLGGTLREYHHAA